MDKLRKIGALLWNYKELMVLVVMLLVLVYRVYSVLVPPPPSDWVRLVAPKSQLPQDQQDRQEIGLPSNPPTRPLMDMPAVYVNFYERNPFWYHSGQARVETSERVTAEDLNVQLLDVQDAGGKPRARLQSARTTAWYSAGEQFEEFELLEIDSDTESVKIFSERYDRPFTLQKR